MHHRTKKTATTLTDQSFVSAESSLPINLDPPAYFVTVNFKKAKDRTARVKEKSVFQSSEKRIKSGQTVQGNGNHFYIYPNISNNM